MFLQRWKINKKMKKTLFNIISHWKNTNKNQNKKKQRIYRLKGWEISSVSGEIRALICGLWNSKWFKYFGKHLIASLAILPKGSGTIVNSYYMSQKAPSYEYNQGNWKHMSTQNPLAWKSKATPVSMTW